MLIVLYGPSCVGKSTIQNVLCRHFGWRPIRCFTTRKPRHNDISRIHVSPAEFQCMSDQNAFFLENVQFGEMYGTSKVDIAFALRSEDLFFVLDFRINDRLQLSPVRHCKILVSVDGSEDLMKRIALANRRDRQEEILSEYRRNYTAENLHSLRAEGFAVVNNPFGALDVAVKNVLALTDGRNKTYQE